MDKINSLASPILNMGASAESRLERMAEESGDKTQFVAEEMERLFATMLVKEMRSGLGAGIFDKGAGNDLYSSWFDEHLGRSLADSGSLQIAGQVKASLGASHKEEI